MNVLILYAHEEPQSFNAAMKNEAIRTFEAMGSHVVVSDLYRMNFKAVADGHDFLERRNPHYLKRQTEELAAVDLGTLSHDILTEQAKLRECDLLVLQFPLWWFSMPAILKGWVDRVMTMGFAYGNGMWYDKGGLKGRKAMLSLTTGGPAMAYEEQSINGSMDQILYPIQHGILYFCGFQVLPPFVAYAPAHASEEDRARMLEEYHLHIARTPSMEPLPFHPLDHYDERMQLKAEQLVK